MEITAEQIAELRALASNATPGPWYADSHSVEIDWIDGGRQSIANCDNPMSYMFTEQDDCNAAYIVAACNALPALLDDVERLRAERDRYRVALDEIVNSTDPANKTVDCEIARAALGDA